MARTNPATAHTKARKMAALSEATSFQEWPQTKQLSQDQSNTSFWAGNWPCCSLLFSYQTQ
jgi:hypothetical protein